MKFSIRGKIRQWLGLDVIVKAMIQTMEREFELERERSASELQKIAEEVQSMETVVFCQGDEITKLTKICASLQDDLESKGEDMMTLDQEMEKRLREREGEIGSLSDAVHALNSEIEDIRMSLEGDDLIRYIAERLTVNIDYL